MQDRLGFEDGDDGDLNVQIGTNFAAKERAKHRIEKKEKDLFGSTADTSVFEVEYEVIFSLSPIHFYKCRSLFCQT